jgi:hypothetical protein
VTYRESGPIDKSISTIEQAEALPQLQNNTVLYEMLGAAYYAKAEAEGTARLTSARRRTLKK